MDSDNTSNGQRQQAAATPVTGSDTNGCGRRRQLWQPAAATGAVLLEITNSL